MCMLNVNHLRFELHVLMAPGLSAAVRNMQLGALHSWCCIFCTADALHGQQVGLHILYRFRFAAIDQRCLVRTLACTDCWPRSLPLQAVRGQHNKVNMEDAIAAVKRSGEMEQASLDAQDEEVMRQMFGQRATHVRSEALRVLFQGFKTEELRATGRRGHGPPDVQPARHPGTRLLASPGDGL